jgi:hypothetical protein
VSALTPGTSPLIAVSGTVPGSAAKTVRHRKWSRPLVQRQKSALHTGSSGDSPWPFLSGTDTAMTSIQANAGLEKGHYTPLRSCHYRHTHVLDVPSHRAEGQQHAPRTERPAAPATDPLVRVSCLAAAHATNCVARTRGSALPRHELPLHSERALTLYHLDYDQSTSVIGA